MIYDTGKAVALQDIEGTMIWKDATSACKNYTVEGISGWKLPSKTELALIYTNRAAVTKGLSTAIGASDFISSYYWSATFSTSADDYSIRWAVNPVTGSQRGHNVNSNSLNVRPVLAL